MTKRGRKGSNLNFKKAFGALSRAGKELRKILRFSSDTGYFLWPRKHSLESRSKISESKAKSHKESKLGSRTEPSSVNIFFPCNRQNWVQVCKWAGDFYVPPWSPAPTLNCTLQFSCSWPTSLCQICRAGKLYFQFKHLCHRSLVAHEHDLDDEITDVKLML